MPAPKLLDVHVNEPTTVVTDAQVAAVRVVGGTEADRVTHGSFCATALATLLENHFATRRQASASSAPPAP